MSIVDDLRGNPLFEGVGEELLTKVSEIASRRSYHRGDTILALGAPSTHVYLLLSGMVLLRLPGRQQDYAIIISTVTEGELFGISPLLGSSRYTSTATSEKNTEVIAIEAKPFAELIHTGKLPAYQIMRHVAEMYFRRYVEVLRLYRIW
jgi:CRP-like cAMP-binding protein